MHILVLNYEFPPVGGGASQASFHMAKELVRQGNTVDVLTSRSRGQPAFESIEGIRVFRAFCWRRGIHQSCMMGASVFLLFAIFKLRKLIAENDYDLAHFFFALPTGALAPYWKRQTDKPYIVSLRGSDVPGYDSTHSILNVVHNLLKPFTRRILHDAEYVVANSHSLRELALESFPDVDISVITNAVSCIAYKPDRQRSSSADVVRAVSVGRLIPRKGLEAMIEGLSQRGSEHVELNIVGDGPLKDELQELAIKVGVDHRLHFRGALQGEELLRAYQQADFFVLPSLSESFSMALLEAMACALPVVASNVGGIPELVEEGKNGYLVAHGDSRALGHAIAKMAESEERRNQFAANNLAKIHDKYTWGRVTNEYVNQCYRWCSALSEDQAAQTMI